MASKSVHILFVILSIVAVAVPMVAAASLGRAGGWKPIGNPNAAQVAAVANFAVAEHNKEKKTSLVLVSVEKGESQVVSGINYRLLISAKDGAAEKTYSTVVYSSLAGSQSLRSFDPIQN